MFVIEQGWPELFAPGPKLTLEIPYKAETFFSVAKVMLILDAFSLHNCI